MSARLQDKVAIITGGGSGIGKAIAKAYVREGAKVLLAARNLANLENTAKELKGMGGTVQFTQTDITSEQQVIDMVAGTMKMFGQIDILVNNSGIGGPTCNVVDMKLSEWNEILATDLTGSMLCARETLKHMIPRKNGTIINLGAEGGRSGDGRSGYPMRAGYCCAKMGVIGLTETLAQEVGEYNIRVNCLSAAAVKGDRFLRVMAGRAQASGTSLEDTIKREMRNYSLLRPAEESELGDVCVFLASEEASAITGQTIVAHCGQHISFR
ncbi:MAG TPA: SDR family NAD(P)-dependent oxidoreductase [Patescibacteria group bacterium]|nr:SDR family NAD(P)-dependent oxidoreductase [Patescibacteria group bacterium]